MALRDEIGAIVKPKIVNVKPFLFIRPRIRVRQNQKNTVNVNISSVGRRYGNTESTKIPKGRSGRMAAIANTRAGWSFKTRAALDSDKTEYGRERLHFACVRLRCATRFVNYLHVVFAFFDEVKYCPTGDVSPGLARSQMEKRPKYSRKCNIKTCK